MGLSDRLDLPEEAIPKGQLAMAEWTPDSEGGWRTSLGVSICRRTHLVRIIVQPSVYCSDET